MIRAETSPGNPVSNACRLGLIACDTKRQHLQPKRCNHDARFWHATCGQAPEGEVRRRRLLSRASSVTLWFIFVLESYEAVASCIGRALRNVQLEPKDLGSCQPSEIAMNVSAGKIISDVQFAGLGLALCSMKWGIYDLQERNTQVPKGNNCLVPHNYSS